MRVLDVLLLWCEVASLKFSVLQQILAKKSSVYSDQADDLANADLEELPGDLNGKGMFSVCFFWVVDDYRCSDACLCVGKALQRGSCSLGGWERSYCGGYLCIMLMFFLLL
jgi:hypothetical protein